MSLFDTTLKDNGLSIDQIKDLKSKCKKNNIILSPSNQIEIINIIKNDGYNVFMELLTNNKRMDQVIWKSPPMKKYALLLDREIFILKAKSSNPTMDKECNKCGITRKVEFISVQTRGADEPQTVFYNCTVCGTSWRD